MSTSAKRLMLRRHFIGAAVLGLSAGMSAGMPAQAQTTTPTITSFTAGDLVINVEGNGSNTFAAAQAAYPGIYGSGTKFGGDSGWTYTTAPAGPAAGYADNSAAPLTLMEFSLNPSNPTGSAATTVGTFELPTSSSTNASGAMNYPISGEYGSSSEGTLQLSANGHYLSVMGYGINPDTYNSSPQTYGPYLSGSTPYYAEAQSTSVPGNPICGPAGSAGTSACTAIPRVLALISANGTVDTSTALTNVFDQQNPRSAYVDGSLIYIAGQGSSGDATGGVFYTTLGSTGNTAVPITGLDSTYSGAASSQDAREVQVYGGQLYMSLDNKSDSPGRAFVGTLGTTGALPTSLANSGNGPTALPGFAGTTSKPQEAVVTLTTANENTIDASGNQTGKTADLSPYNYFFANATTLYIADGGNPKGNAGSSSYGLGGLQKWTYNGTTWQLLYTLSVGLNLVKYNASTGTTGLYGLAGKVIPGGQVELFATNATAADEDQTYLYGIVDTLSNTTPPGTNEAFT
jgi:hypothetical protein